MDNDIRDKTDSYLSFNIGGEVFAAHVSQVLNILEMTKITKVPQTPDYMVGVINLRGNVLPVIDSRIKFSLPFTEYTSNTCIIVMELNMDGQTVQVGTIVDAVQEVLDISEEQIQPAPSIGSKYRTEFLEGMGKIGEEFIMILNINKVFSEEDVQLLKQNQDSQEAE
jgi:purine-binding chemotaxis protein CheW